MKFLQNSVWENKATSEKGPRFIFNPEYDMIGTLLKNVSRETFKNEIGKINGKNNCNH